MTTFSFNALQTAIKCDSYCCTPKTLLRASATFLEALETLMHIAKYYGLNVGATPQSYVEILTPGVMVSGVGAFGRRLGQRDGVFVNGICAFIRRDTELACFLLSDM